jgi:tRNA-specific 2-thiouridylase
MRVVVAMSGGVDSSVAAALLKKQGYEVIGITMCFGLADSQRKRPACCGIKAIEDARRVAHKLGIRHYVLNMQRALEEYVIRDFCREYLRARTPNPCVRCNQYLKFGVLLKKALGLDADFLATGHYARIERAQYAIRNTQYYLLKKAKDKHKDQSYFLYRLGQEQLRHVVFPLGNYTKDQVRALARKFALPTAEKKASQEICFLPQDNYRRFLEARMRAKIRPGLVVDSRGNTLGRHKGICFYTIGQREGLGIAAGWPLYITGIDAKRNLITVGKKDEVFKKEFLIRDPHFILMPIKKKIVAATRIRYNHREARSEILLCKKNAKVCFSQPQFAITPGQAAVFYDKDTVLGGGVIEEVLS